MNLLPPKFLKYKKTKKGKLTKLDFKSTKIMFGNIGLKAIESGYITLQQLKSIHNFLKKKIKKKGKIWFRVFPNIPTTSKPLETRMGKGKGAVKNWVCRVCAGKVLFEIVTILNEPQILTVLNKIAYKLSIKTKIVKQ